MVIVSWEFIVSGLQHVKCASLVRLKLVIPCFEPKTKYFDIFYL